ncbi:MAG: methylmalonyl Co-A mutase-associated GTPase MeaB [Burkholderiales bacterium]|nr:methylmalonyl Co-A mutase-associated GTPase MeaB [Burkholderiales bacterium]
MDQAAAARLAQAVLQGDRRALARALTVVENRWAGGSDLMSILRSRRGCAKVIGVTGSGGAGKSTLVCALAAALLGRGRHVAVVAIDPSSPLSGGAVLGDRVRMSALADSGAYIRSLATRGAVGGLCQAAREVVDVLDAAGFDIVLVETVGVGQDEVDVMRLADQVLVVCTPGQGDGVQAIKAGVMEIADLFVVNKFDQAGAHQVVSQLEQMLATRGDPARRNRPVFGTTATTGEGVGALADRLLSLGEGGRRRPVFEQQLADEVLRLLQPQLRLALQRHPGLADQGAHDIARRMLGNALGDPPGDPPGDDPV